MTNTINENHDMQEVKGGCCGGNDNKSECCGGNEMKNESDCCGGNETVGCGCGSDHDHDHHGHDHDHDHDHAHMVTFENEDGTTEEYPIVDEFEVDGQVYILVMNGDETVTPLRVEGEEGELVFLAEEEFQKVSEAYAALADSEELQ